MTELDELFKATPEYAELMSILEETKKEITKLQVNVQASVDLKNLPHEEISKKIDWMINNRETEENRDEYICCILSEMTEKSELNWQLFRQTKYWQDFLSQEETVILSWIDWWRTQYLSEHIWDQSTRDKIKNLLKKLIKTYKGSHK